jgi:hypothetical protein
MNLHPSEVAFLKALAMAKASWKAAAAEGIASDAVPWAENDSAWRKLAQSLSSEDRAAFLSVVDDLLSGIIHSTLVTLDGGSALSETTLLTIQDNQGYEFKRFLHEFWPEFKDAPEA